MVFIPSLILTHLWCLKLIKTKILYIAAHSRSGSTVLDRALAQVDGAFTVGEIRNIWHRSFTENQLCGCNQKFNECQVWQKIVSETNIDTTFSENMHKLSRVVDRYKKIPQIIYPSLRGSSLNKQMIEYQEGLSKIYTGVVKTVRPEFIIDSSKSSSYAMHMQQLKEFDVHIIHLVRDSRSVAFSRLRKKKRPEIHWKDEYMAQTPAYKTGYQWDLMNVSMDLLKCFGGYTLVRYEDFMRNPKDIVGNIMNDIGLYNKSISFIKDKQIELGVDHTVSGNPMRFKTGNIELRVDDQWKGEMTKFNKNIVTAMTYTQLKKYGYV